MLDSSPLPLTGPVFDTHAGSDGAASMRADHHVLFRVASLWRAGHHHLLGLCGLRYFGGVDYSRGFGMFGHYILFFEGGECKIVAVVGGRGRAPNLLCLAALAQVALHVRNGRALRSY